jgi:hypothetical protein
MTRHCIAVMLFVLLGLSMSVVAQKPTPAKKVLVSGTVMGFDGKPAAKAHVHFERPQWGTLDKHTYVVSVAPNGSFMMKLPEAPYRVRFTGVNHQRTDVRWIYVDAEKSNTLHCRLPLSRFYPATEIDSIIVHPFGPLGRLESVRMHETRPGAWEAVITLREEDFPSDYQGTLPAQRTIAYNLQGIMPQRFVNGTQSDGYDYDGDGDYYSLLNLKSGVRTFELRFDRSLLPDPGTADASAFVDSVGGSALQHPVGEMIARLQALNDSLALLRAPSSLLPVPGSLEEALDNSTAEEAARLFWPRDSVALNARFDRIGTWLAKVVDSLLRRFEEIEDRSSREFTETGLSLLAIQRQGSVPEQRDIVKKIFSHIPPASPWWGFSLDFLESVKYLRPDSLSYLRDVARNHPSRETRLLAYRIYLGELQEGGADSTLRHTVFREAEALAKGTDHERHVQKHNPSGAEWMQWLIEDKKRFLQECELYGRREAWSERGEQWAEGKRLPAFSLASLEDSTAVLSNNDLEGKPCLLALVSSTSLEYWLPVLILAQRQYASAGLQIVILFDEEPGAPTFPEYRARGVTFPGFVTDWKRTNSFRGFLTGPKLHSDKMLLVDTNGVIRYSGDHMAEEAFVMYSLEAMLGGVDQR